VALNRFFELFEQKQEQELLSDLMAECIEIHGMNVFYLPRRHENLNSFLGEDPTSIFDTVYEMEAYMKSTDRFERGPDFVSIQGLEIRDSAIFTFSRKLWEERTYGSNLVRPNEGDLLFLPMTNSIFEVGYTEDERPFYQLGSLTVWDVTVYLFEYSNERFRTDVPDIDSIEDRYARKVEIVVSSLSGEFEYNERVYQGPSSNAAVFWGEVLSYDADNNTLTVKHYGGTLAVSTAITGAESGATANVVSSNIAEAGVDDELSDNEVIETEGDVIVDFDPNNPFGGT